MALLSELYGHSTIEKLKIDQKSMDTSSGKKIEISLISSLYHVEVNPSDVGYYDRIIIQDIIKEIAKTQQVNINAPHPYKAVVIHEADNLTREAQHALRRTMEKYMSNLRLFLVCNHLGKIIEPLQSRCVLIRLPCPSHESIDNIMSNIVKKEGLSLSKEIAQKIINDSKGNLRRALLSLQLALDPISNQHSKVSNMVLKPDWEEYIDQLVSFIIQEQSPARLAATRTRLYELLTHCIPPNTIIKQLAFGLIQNVEEPLKIEITRFAAQYDSRMIQGSKAIFHLEAFIAKFMSVYKRYLLELA